MSETTTTKVRVHLLTITKSDDWTEDDPDWDWTIACSSPELCNGWWECREPHALDGRDAGSGPYDCEPEAPWCDEGEFTFHGVEHTWRWGFGWTVPYVGCVVQTADVSDDVWEIARANGPGSYEVDDEWDDTSCYLTAAAPVRPEAGA